ncbi:MAG: hypothetical protein WAL52_20675 [Candidatus Sulfotelmatobacter sp.]
MNIVKVLGVALLGIVSLLVLLAVVLPAVSLLLGLGVDIPSSLPRAGKALFFDAHPWLSLLVGALFLALLGWGAWKLLKGD